MCFLSIIVVPKVALVWSYVTHVSFCPQWISFLCIPFIFIVASSFLMNFFLYFSLIHIESRWFFYYWFFFALARTEVYCSFILIMSYQKVLLYISYVSSMCKVCATSLELCFFEAVFHVSDSLLSISFFPRDFMSQLILIFIVEENMLFMSQRVFLLFFCFICLTLPRVNQFCMHTLFIYLTEFLSNELFSLLS